MKPEECKLLSRAYAAIDMDAIRENIMSMKSNISPDTRMVLVIKTDGYGHGAIPIAKLAEGMDHIWGYAVATFEEALDLRDVGIGKPILILGYTFDYCYRDMARLDIRPAVFRDEQLEGLSKAARAEGRKIKIHIKVDTGMNRIGIRPEEGTDFVRRAFDTPGIAVEGMFTHFARADEKDRTNAYGQMEAFKAFADRIENETGRSISLVHCSNSAGIMAMREANMSLVRAGITLYGLMPSGEMDPESMKITPVMSLISHISHIKEIGPGEAISYGGTFVTDKRSLIATVPVGYGDGYPRLLSNKGEVLIRGMRAPIRGRVCMDQFMVDVTDIPGVSHLDKVTLIGRDGDDEITMDELGEISGRFNYELACDIGKRIPRVYVRNGDIEDIILEGKHIKW